MDTDKGAQVPITSFGHKLAKSRLYLTQQENLKKPKRLKLLDDSALYMKAQKGMTADASIYRKRSPFLQSGFENMLSL